MPQTTNDPGPHDALIGRLAADLTPVRRLSPPHRQALAWLAAVAAAAIVLAALADIATMAARLAAASDLWLAVVGEVATMVLAAFAAFALGRPDASRAWALAPLPALVLWLAATGAGCLRDWVVPGTADIPPMEEARECLTFILAVSIPLSALMIFMLRRSLSLQPGLTAAMAGLAAAAAAATLLNFFHPFDATATDLAVHTGAVLLVVVASRRLGAKRIGNISAPV
ncbi:NrsF family protein [Xanthobacteraceae bacterium Astr-EGSB]|uniref:NrsF family protein n=1 Tax=Astrobacterium formosum TaxID=3069710 RepID=UPI0027B62E11|nr:NrsF family protein [Xanthobacteraceae bacterium Astr-EGSB]